MRIQVILDSSFARQGSDPIWGGKKGEFRDWTRQHQLRRTAKACILVRRMNQRHVSVALVSSQTELGSAHEQLDV